MNDPYVLRQLVLSLEGTKGAAELHQRLSLASKAYWGLYKADECIVVDACAVEQCVLCAPSGRAAIFRWSLPNGDLHRGGDLPAVGGAGVDPKERPAIWPATPDGWLEWWKRGMRHRSGGRPAVVVEVDNYKPDGWPDPVADTLRRGDPLLGVYTLSRVIDVFNLGVAVKRRVEWWENGRRHRIGGPAIIHKKAGEACEWRHFWEEGVYLGMMRA